MPRRRIGLATAWPAATVSICWKDTITPTYDARPRPLFLNGPTLPEPRTFSERTAEAIDGEVRRLLDEARERVSKTLGTHRAALESLAALLLEKEVVDRAMLDGLMASSVAPAQLRVAAVAQLPADGAP